MQRHAFSIAVYVVIVWRLEAMKRQSIDPFGLSSEELLTLSYYRYFPDACVNKSGQNAVYRAKSPRYAKNIDQVYR